MPFSVAVAGGDLQIVYADGTVQTLTLPTGVTISDARPPYFAILGRNVILAGAPDRPIWIDPDATVRPVQVPTPSRAPTLAASAGAGTLSGTFRVKVSYVVKDHLGVDLMESNLSQASAASPTLTNKKLAMSNIPLSASSYVNARRFYRTATGPGEEYFEWFDIDDNTTTSFEDDTADAALSLFPAPDDHGQAPNRLTRIVEWKNRIWGVNAADLDGVVFSADGKLYAWPSTNQLPAGPAGGDRFGVVGLIPRRDELAIGRRDRVWKVIGNDETDFRMVILVEGKGILAPGSIVVARDVGRWLADDGVYEWDAAGVRCISDDDAKAWFTTDTYFNRALFPQAFARYNPLRHSYELFLAPVGGSTFTRWVSYDIDRKKWLGPHLTSAFTPTSAGVVYDASELKVPCVAGSDGKLYLVTPGTYHDGTSTAIDFDVTVAHHTGNAPDIEHFWGLLSILTKKLAGGTLDVICTTGDLSASPSATISHDMTTGRQKLRRAGVGRLLKVRLRNNEVDRETEVYGYELPFHELGRR